jgi:hypothetical protein
MTSTHHSEHITHDCYNEYDVIQYGVAEVTPGGNMEALGVKAGDLLLYFNGEEVIENFPESGLDWSIAGGGPSLPDRGGSPPGAPISLYLKR